MKIWLRLIWSLLYLSIHFCWSFLNLFYQYWYFIAFYWLFLCWLLFEIHFKIIFCWLKWLSYVRTITNSILSTLFIYLHKQIRENCFKQLKRIDLYIVEIDCWSMYLLLRTVASLTEAYNGRDLNLDLSLSLRIILPSITTSLYAGNTRTVCVVK